MARLVADPELSKLVELGFGEKLLKVSWNHPMLVSRNKLLRRLQLEKISRTTNNKNQGQVPAYHTQLAQDLALEDEVLTADGTFQEISHFKRLPVEEHQLVYTERSIYFGFIKSGEREVYLA